MRYDYFAAVRSDVLEHIVENYTLSDVVKRLDDVESWKEELHDDCWSDDNVTGNASGSYTMNRWKAKENVEENIDILADCCRDFGLESATIGKMFLDEAWEKMDVSIRCYVLKDVIDELLDALSECQDALAAEIELTADRMEEIVKGAA